MFIVVLNQSLFRELKKSDGEKMKKGEKREKGVYLLFINAINKH